MKLLKDDKRFCKAMKEIYEKRGSHPANVKRISVKKALDFGLVYSHGCGEYVRITSEGVDFCERELGLGKQKPQ